MSDNIETDLKHVSSLFSDELDCFGLDQKILYIWERDGANLPIVKSYYRPVQEVVIFSFWNNLIEIDFNECQAVEIASLLVGSRQSIRVAPMIGQAPDGSDFTFAERPAHDWIEKLQDCQRESNNAIELAANLYKVVVMEHPFTDGNGRFSRALIYGALGRYGLVNNPCLGLNGVFEIHRAAMATALQQSCKQKSPDPLIKSILLLLNDSIQIVKRLYNR